MRPLRHFVLGGIGMTHTHADLIAAGRMLATEARADVRQAAIGPIARPLVTRLADMCQSLADALQSSEGKATEGDAYWLMERDGKWYSAAPHSLWTLTQAVESLYDENWTT